MGDPVATEFKLRTADPWADELRVWLNRAGGVSIKIDEYDFHSPQQAAFYLDRDQAGQLLTLLGKWLAE